MRGLSIPRVEAGDRATEMRPGAGERGFTDVSIDLERCSL